MATSSSTSSSTINPSIPSHTIPSDLATTLPHPKTPWHVSAPLFERMQKQASSTSKPFVACPVTSSDPEYNFVLKYFFQTKPPGYGIRSIQCIHNPVQTVGFEMGLKAMEAAAEKLHPSWKSEAPVDQRVKTIERWQAQTAQFSPLHLTSSKRTDVCVKAKVLPLWHGTAHTESICTSGFTYFGKHHLIDPNVKAGPNASTDIGYFGSGIYFTNSAAYAAMYNTGKLLLAWVSMREPYPVVSDVPIPDKGSDMSKLEGRGAYQNYNAHYIPVTSIEPQSQDNMIYHPCHGSEIPAWDELVVFQPSQTLARFQIDLGVDLPGSPSLMSLLQAMIPKEQKQSLPSTIPSNSASSSSSTYIPGIPGLSSSSVQSLPISTNTTTQQAKSPAKQATIPSNSTSSSSSTYIPDISGLSSSSVQPLPISTNTTAQLSAAQATATLEQLKIRVLQGDADAQYELGSRYFEARGVQVDLIEAMRLWLLAADQGHNSAQYKLGEIYYKGERVLKNWSEAIKWYRLAADQGNTYALYWLGEIYSNGGGSGLWLASDLSEAIKWYRLAADQGCKEAQERLGRIYYLGQGVTKDTSEAIKWFRLAADQGCKVAQEWLGEMYYNGEGVAKNMSEARKWYHLAAEGNADKQCAFGGYFYSRDWFEGIQWYRLAADQGHKGAQCVLGKIYFNGEGVIKDVSEGIKWYRLAADQGDMRAQMWLGDIYFDGKGVTKDWSEGIKWYRLAVERNVVNADKLYLDGLKYSKSSDIFNAITCWRLAAAQGNKRAQEMLGETYHYGGGSVTPDWSEAKKWYLLAAEGNHAGEQYRIGKIFRYTDASEAIKLWRLAAEQGYKEAQKELGHAYYHGQGVTKDLSEGIKWYRLAAGQGDINAQCVLGNIYCKGEGVIKNVSEGIKWYRLAAVRGDMDAQYMLGNIYYNGEGIIKNVPEGIKWYRLAADQIHIEARKKLDDIERCTIS